MNRHVAAAVVVTLVAAGAVVWLVSDSGIETGTTPSARKILHYKDPMGGPDTSPVPKKDSMGMDYLPVYADEGAKQAASASDRGRLLYYRNPMGLADTSPTPKKDSMGMDYIPVYEHEFAAPGAVKIDTARLQRAGVRTAKAEMREMTHEIQAVGSVALDEARIAVVAPRADGFIERVYVGATGLPVRAGQALIDVYSPEIVQLQEEYRLAKESEGAPTGAAGTLADSALRRLENLGVSQAHIRDIAAGRTRRVLTLGAPISGVVTKKAAVQGQRFMAGEQLYEIADISSVWVVAKVFEHDLGAVSSGSRARITVTALPGRTFDGIVSFVAPQISAETRTADVRIEIPNADGALRAQMYAAVVLPTAKTPQVVAVPDSAIVDSGTRQVVLVAKGDGTFEPRDVTRGARSGGYTGIEKGVTAGEEVVVDAAFLIDAESNLKAALGAFSNAPPAAPERKP